MTSAPKAPLRPTRSIRRLLPRALWVKVILLLVLAAWMIPIIYMVSVSLRPPDRAFAPTLWSWPVTFANFRTVITENPLFQNFANSLIVTVATVVVVAVSAACYAFAHSVLALRGTRWIYPILLTTLMVPIASLVLPLAIMLKNFGWVNQYIGLIAPYAALGIPFAAVILKAFFDDSPRELYEAALIDGCNQFQLFRFVAVPLVRPAVVFVVIWQFITTWNEFFLALVILTSASKKTLTLVPMQYSGFYMANPGALFAVLVIIAIPLIVLYVAVQRYFVAGLMAGAIKG